ncbi:MAG: TRAP transporter substrate-binding protein [Roseovarius sp.]
MAGTALAEPDFKFKFANVDAPQSIGGHGTQVFADCMAEQSGGRVEIQIFPSGALGGQSDNLESVRTDLLDLTNVVSPIVTVDPLLSVFTLPYVFRDRDHVANVLKGEVGDLVSQRLQDRDLVVLGYWEGGFRQITNNVRPINVPDDLEGIKIRTPSDPTRIMMFDAMGASAAALPWSEVYSALQTGVFDGQENPALYVEDASFYEVQKYLSFTSHVYGVSYLLMSKGAFGKLPEDLQKVAFECGRVSADATVEYGTKADAEAADKATERGMEVNEADIPAFMAAARPMHAEMIEKTLKGDDVQKAKDLLKAIEDTQ